MSSRGSVIANGHVTTTEYQLKDGKMVYDAKVLVGTTKRHHSLPDYSHSPCSIYIKENSDGSFREMRIFDKNRFPVLEIAYHPEKKLTGNQSSSVLHYHTFGSDLRRKDAEGLSATLHPDIYKKYKKYLKEYGL